MSDSPKIAILTYHSLDDSGSVLSISPALFAEQMRTLRDIGANVIGLEDLLARPDDSAAQGPGVAITFDDGFRNIREPVLAARQEYGFPMTVFLVTDHCDGNNNWPGQPGGIPPQPMLRWSEVREMDGAGVSFGSHTRTHPDLTSLPPDEAEEQLRSSKKAIEDALGQPVGSHAYPYGTHDRSVRSLAARHFQLACTTRLAFLSARADPLALDRLDMYYLQNPATFRRLFTRRTQAYIALRRNLRTIRSLVQ